MMMIIDHLVYAAPDLAAAVDDLEGRLGVRAKAGGKHLDIGTHNALLALGPRIYLELIGPDPDQPQPANPRPFGIDELAAPRLVGWALGCDDIDAAVATARQRGYDPGDPIDMQRAASSGEVLRWRLTLNALGGGPLPFLIAWGDTPHPSVSAPHGLVLESLDIEHPEPREVAGALVALGADVAVKPAASVALVAHVRCRDGMEEVR
jgi:hypothetical protein